MSEEVEKLTPKQKLFIEKYLGEARFNATKAAELAGYKGNRVTLGAVAYENLKKPQIKAEIDLVLSVMSIPANVVITRLTEISEGKISDFYNEEGKFDLELAKSKGIDHLLKKIKRKTTSKVITDGEEEIETHIILDEVEFEIYSAHEALRDLGKHHKLFVDRQEIDANVNLKSIDEYNKEADERLKKAEEAFRSRNE